MNLTLSRAQKWTLALIVVSICVIYGRLLVVGAINWDDDSNIFKNPYYLGGVWAPYWTHPYFGLYVPVTTTIWQSLFTLGQGAAWPYRVLNLTLHLSNTGMVFLIFAWLSRRWAAQTLWPAIAATTVFALHPLQVHAVAWISGGRDLISGFFTFLSLILYFRLGGWRGAAWSTAFFTLAVFSKPNAVALAALIPLLTLAFDRDRLKIGLVTAMAWMGVVGVSMWKTLWAQRDYLTPLELWQRLFVLGDTYSFYIQKILVPFPLSANYNRRPEVLLESAEPYVRTLGFIALAALLVIWAYRRERRFWLPALAWLLLLLPVSGLVPFGYQKVSTTADHYHYLPMVALGAGLLLVGWWSRGVTLALLAGLSALSFARMQVWTSDKRFFENMAAYAPNTYSTGMGMSVLKCKQERDFKSGIDWIRISLAERPNDMMALSNLAYCLFNSKDWAATVALLPKLNELNLAEMEEKQPSSYASFLASVGSALFEVNREEEGYLLICEAFRLRPSDPQNAYNMEVAANIMRKKGLDPVCRRF